MAARDPARRGPGRGLRAARRMAARALAVRGPDPRLRGRNARAGARDERSHDAWWADPYRAAAGALVAAARCGHRCDHLGVPSGIRRRPRLGGHRFSSRAAARGAVPRRDTRGRIPFRRSAARRPPVPGDPHVRRAIGRREMASARNARDQRRTFTADCAACPPGHTGVSRACLRCRVVHGFTARPGARRGDHCASRRLDRGTREHAGRIPRGDGRRSDLLRAGRAAHSRRPDRGAARR